MMRCSETGGAKRSILVSLIPTRRIKRGTPANLSGLAHKTGLRTVAGVPAIIFFSFRDSAVRLWPPIPQPLLPGVNALMLVGVP